MSEALAGLHRPYRVASIRLENAATRTLVLDRSLAADPGQFVMAWLPDVGEKPFSLAGADPVCLTVAAVGPFSRALHTLAVGDRIWLRGPLGRGFAPPSPAGHALLVGGGYGVAPLRFLAERLLAAGWHVSAIVGARRAADLLLVEALAALGVRLWLTTEDGSVGLRGLATDAFDAALTAAPEARTTVFACGPVGMLAAVAALCRTRGLPVQLAWEAHMRCAVGLCGSCEVGAGWLTCLDGPVFPCDPTVALPMG
ncbi:MAG: hypothetical protein NZ528_01755 [Caldilineales bacterium]|nr:hypothetical protein [Caldilineales bacterium]MDW8316319.1 dihydroorotate dehydrogenase electron transfer subunit [Anaerolineae bacterium]